MYHKSLKSGAKIPVLGLGTWQLRGDECRNIIRKALEIGYRHIDTAQVYGNQSDIGAAISDFPREKLFITSKIWRDSLGYEEVHESCEDILSQLGAGYVDLLLIHWPNSDVDMSETFRAFKDLMDNDKVVDIGVSNFTIQHLKKAMNVSPVPLSMNQVEFHPFLYQKELMDFCLSRNIELTAYSPIARGGVLGNNLLEEIGEKYRKSPSQVSLRWLIQKGLITIPKSGSEDHLRENIDIFDFELDVGDVQAIDNIGEHKRLLNPGFAEFDKAEA